MKTINLDAIDRKILKFLVKNARMPFLEIARECGISGAAIHQRIHKLTEAGVIQGSYMVVNPKMLGFDVCAHINISLKDPQQLQQVIDELQEIPEIVEAHFTTGPYSIIVKLYARDNEHLMNLLNERIQEIPGVMATETMISLDQSIKKEIPISVE